MHHQETAAIWERLALPANSCMRTDYFTTDYLSIGYFPKKNMAEVEWLGYALSEEFRTGMKAILQLAQEKGVQKWLVNGIEMSRLSKPDQLWASQYWYPEFCLTNTRKVATILPQDIATQLSVSAVMSHVRPLIGYQSRYFSSIPPAMRWLETELAD